MTNLVASNQIQQFINKSLGVSITATDRDGTIWFLAKNIADALGYNQTQKALDHCRQSSILDDLNKINILHPMSKWIPESDLYRLVMKSTLPKAELLQDWVCGEVIPSIRKTGSYLGAKKPILDLRDQKQLSAIALQLIEITQEQAKQIEMLTPKAKAIDRLRAVEGSMAISDAAKTLGMKRDAFFEMLNKIKWIFKRSDVWLGYESARSKGFIDHRPVEAGGKVRTQCVLTPKGLSEIAMIMDIGMPI